MDLKVRDAAGKDVASQHVKATIVDHIIAKRRGGSNDEHNLQPLCVACHNHKTDLFDGGGWR